MRLGFENGSPVEEPLSIAEAGSASDVGYQWSRLIILAGGKGWLAEEGFGFEFRFRSVGVIYMILGLEGKSEQSHGEILQEKIDESSYGVLDRHREGEAHLTYVATYYGVVCTQTLSCHGEVNHHTEVLRIAGDYPNG